MRCYTAVRRVEAHGVSSALFLLGLYLQLELLGKLLMCFSTIHAI